ncbi:MAG: CaiB/BaiF CoA transferase family protein [Gemmatimonadota bacterium]
MTAATNSATAPLEGLRILDLTRLLPGPAATMHLADFGADVIKVEDTGEGDYMRSIPPAARSAEGREVNAAFEAINRGKRSIRIDLKSPAGSEVLWKLIDTADALIEQFRPGVLERLGFGWDAVHARNPRLVLCSLSGYGQSGPWAQAAGHDINYAARTGVLDQNRAGGRPAVPNLQIGDLLGGTLTMLSALLIALLAARRTGVGARVDAAMTDGLLVHHLFPVADLDAGNTPIAERTLLTGGAACYGVYETADRQHLAVGALELKFWQAFCDAAGLPELKSRHWSLGEAPGSAAALVTRENVAARLRQRSRAEWEAAFASVDCCVTPILSPAEALAQPHHHARGLVHKRGGVTAIGPLAQISGHAFEVRPAPSAGEHTAALLRGLGYDDAAIENLLATGAVKDR